MKGDYVGQTDYIFRNAQSSYFVIEEKFQYESVNGYVDDEKRKFHANHVNQLISYLHGIADYPIDYGYLIYWKFDFDWGAPFVHSCFIKKITKSEATRKQIIAIYTILKNFLNTKTLNFDVTKRNPKKCANCVSNLICGHKTGKFATLTFPYSLSYLNTQYVEFPKELKKDYVPDDQNGVQQGFANIPADVQMPNNDNTIEHYS